MKKSLIKSLVFLLMIPLFLTFGRSTDLEDRYFDNTPEKQKSVVLAVCYPSIGSLKALVSLRDHRLIDIDDLLIVGVYYDKESTDYHRSKQYVKNNYIDWIKFHEIKGDINQDELFQNNILTPEFEKIFKKSDGIIFFGGADIPPYIYGDKTSLLTSISTPYRSLYELSFIFHLLGGSQNQEYIPFLDSSPEYPILGICLGAQSLNVGTGGTLVQDIWKDVYDLEYLEDIIEMPESVWHTNPHARLHPEKNFFPYKLHPIKFDPKGKFVREFDFKSDDSPYILSAHHQAAGKTGLGFLPTAFSSDGRVLEAIEHEHFPYVLGVQFHPEFPLLYDEISYYNFTPDDTEKTNIFSFLKENHPSFAFHQKIWSWFSYALNVYHQKNGAGPR